MATLNYRLRGNSIQLVFSYGRKNLFRANTGYKVSNPNNWLDSQKIKNVAEEFKSNTLITPNEVNSKLDSLRNRFLEEYNSLIENEEVINKDVLKVTFLHLNKLKQSSKKNKKHPSFIELFEDFIADSENGKRKHRRKSISKGTVKNYKTVLAFFKEYSKYQKAPILFQNIDENFYFDICDYIDEVKNTSLNYKSKIIKILKTYLKYANSKGVKLTNYYPETFIVEEETADDIALSLSELSKMFDLDLTYDKNLERARDLFLIGAYTGLRFSNFNNLNNESIKIVDGVECFQCYIHKTDKELLVPISKKVKAIIKRNNGVPEKMYSQALNKHIKTVGELAMIEDIVTKEYTRGGKKIKKSYYKYELIKSHTARRSFCTNAYLSEVDSITIMGISGHTTQSNFLKYIKVPPKDHAKRLANHKFFELI